MSDLRAPKGTFDILPPDSARFLAVRETLTAPLRRAGYGYVETPVFEDTAVFSRGVGESTDVVTKEMYTFDDRGGRSLTLRPELTAGLMRAFIEHRLHDGALPVKLWTVGSAFRYERPQAGRYRHFTQVDMEALGVDDPALDAEVVALGVQGFRDLGLTDFELLLTSLGDSTCRPQYRELLVEFLAKLDLDEDTRRRAEINPLRVLDDNRPEVQAQLDDAPLMVDHLSDSTKAHYDAVRQHLTDLGVTWTEAPKLVRGLDYYTKTTFEFVHNGLGAQSAIGGGGRYDGLSAALGGPDVSGHRLRRRASTGRCSRSRPRGSTSARRRGAGVRRPAGCRGQAARRPARRAAAAGRGRRRHRLRRPRAQGRDEGRRPVGCLARRRHRRPRPGRGRGPAQGHAHRGAARRPGG